MNPACPSCGSHLYDRDAYGVWRCVACSITESRRETGGSSSYIDRLSSEELARDRLNHLFERTVEDLRAYVNASNVERLYRAQRTARELVRKLHLAKDPERILRLADLIHQEAQRFPNGAVPKPRRPRYW